MWEVVQPGFFGSYSDEEFGIALAVNTIDPHPGGELDFAVAAPGNYVRYAKGHVGAVFQFSFTGRRFQHLRTYDQLGTDINDPGDRFGFDMVGADFNGDSRWDLAISAPMERFQRSDNVGQVYVYYGHQNAQEQAQRLQPITWDAPPGNQWFGLSSVHGDFNGDGFDDLAVGSPGSVQSRDHTEHSDAIGKSADYPDPHGHRGVVSIFNGSPVGLSLIQHKFPIQASKTTNVTIVDFGVATGSGDFNNDGYSDLVVVSKEIQNPGGIKNDGHGAGSEAELNSTKSNLSLILTIYHGSMDGLVFGNRRVLAKWRVEPEFSRNQVPSAIDFALTTGDLKQDGGDDFVIAILNPDPSLTPCEAQSIQVYMGDSLHDVLPATQILKLPCDISRTNDDGAKAELTVASLAVGDFNADGRSDLMVGAPYARVGIENTEVGALYQYLGTPGGFGLPGLILQFGGRLSAGDRFGDSLATFTRMPHEADALLIGAPGERVGGTRRNSGAVYFLD